MDENKKVMETEDAPIVENKPGFFKRMKAKVSTIPATIKYIGCGVAGAVVLGLVSAVAANRRDKPEPIEVSGEDLTIEQALELDPDVVDV